METAFWTIIAVLNSVLVLFAYGRYWYERGKSDAWKVVTEIIEEMKQEQLARIRKNNESLGEK